MKDRSTLSQRAQLFSQLALLERAGLPAATALTTLQVASALATKLKLMQRLVAKGVDIAAAGQRSGLFRPFETELVRAACKGGSPEPTFARIAADYERRAGHRSAVRAKLALPAALFVLTLLIQPLPQLIGGTFGLAGYLVRAVLPLACVAALLWALTTAPVIHARAALVSRLPLFGPMHARRAVRDLFQNLALLLEAGLPLATAFPIALKTIQDQSIAARFASVGKLLANGTALTVALQSVRFTRSADAIGFVRTGEASGTLPAMLQQIADRETDSINRFDALVAEWSPRLVYAAIAVWTAWRVIHDTLALQTVPSDL